MRNLIAIAALALLLPLLPPAAAAPDLDGAIFVDPDGTVHAAEFGWSGICVGEQTLTVTIHRPAGDDVREVDVDALMLPDACFTPQCFECPPVPMAFSWTMRGAEVHLVGGGVSYYDHYGFQELAWSLQGPFQEGTLEAHGVIG